MRQVAILATLLGVALLGSYLSWTSEGADLSRATDVRVYRADARDLESVAWRSDTLEVRLERRDDGAGDYVWITVTETPEEPEPIVDADPAAPVPVSATGSTVAFKGNDAAKDLWESFAPLYAKRELQVTGMCDVALGFDSPTAILEVTRRSGPLELVVGDETYGTRDRYVRHGERVLLLDDRTLRPLQFAKTRLVDRALHPVGPDDARRIEVRSGGDEITLVQRNREDRRAAFWAQADTPEEAHRAGENWVGKLLRLRAQGYVSEADLEGDLAPIFSFTIEGSDGRWQAEIFRQTGVEDPQYFARTTWNRSLVQLTESLAAEAVADLDTLLP